MRILLDTNILMRLTEPGDAMHQDALDATKALGNQGHILCLVPQNFYEFWAVSTRPTTNNGLGKTKAEAAIELANLRGLFTYLDDTPALFTTWEHLVTTHSVVGLKAHDARPVAAMLVHGVSHLLTFNDADFRRYSGVTVLTPSQVLAGASAISPAPPALPPPP